MSAALPTIPVHDLDAEAVVLSAALLLGPEAVDEISGVLAPRDLYSNPNQLVLEAVFAVHETSAPVDLVSVARWLRDHGKLDQVGGGQYLGQITDAQPAIANWQEHARTVRKLSRQRELVALSAVIRAKGLSPCDDLDKLLGEIETLVWDATRPTPSDSESIVTLAQAVEPHAHELRNPRPSGTSIIPTVGTGLWTVDERFGQTPRGEILVVAGRPGSGKTSLALQVMLANARLGTGVAIISTEMRQRQLAARMLCQASSVSSTNYRRGQLSETDRTLMIRQADEISKLPILIDDQRFPTLGQIRRKARRMAAELSDRYGVKLRMLVVDHFHRLNHELGKNDAREDQAMTRTVLGLSSLAAELDCVLLLLAQLNRGSESRATKETRPRMSDLKGCGGLEENAFLGLLLHRPELLDPGDRKGLCEVIGGKVRDGGEVSVLNVGFEGPTTTFYDLSSPPEQRRGPDDQFGD